MSVCHGGNSDDLVSIPAMIGTVAVDFCVYFNGLYKTICMKINEDLAYMVPETLYQPYSLHGMCTYHQSTRSTLKKNSKVKGTVTTRFSTFLCSCLFDLMMALQSTETARSKTWNSRNSWNSRKSQNSPNSRKSHIS